MYACEGDTSSPAIFFLSVYIYLCVCLSVCLSLYLSTYLPTFISPCLLPSCLELPKWQLHIWHARNSNGQWWVMNSIKGSLSGLRYCNRRMAYLLSFHATTEVGILRAVLRQIYFLCGVITQWIKDISHWHFQYLVITQVPLRISLYLSHISPCILGSAPWSHMGKAYWLKAAHQRTSHLVLTSCLDGSASHSVLFHPVLYRCCPRHANLWRIDLLLTVIEADTSKTKGPATGEGLCAVIPRTAEE